jgi:phosphoglucomutase
MNGQKEIADMMEGYRTNTPTSINGSPVVQLLDYQQQKGRNLETGEAWSILLPKSNVLQFILADGSKISARPSGTEPKIKFYFSVHAPLQNRSDFDAVHHQLNQRIEGILEDLQLV